MNHPDPAHNEFPTGWRIWLRVAVRIGILIALIAMIVFSAAGRLDWAAAWLSIILYTIFLVVVFAWGITKSPELMRERGGIAPNVKTWDKLVNALYALLLIALLVIAGLDAGRFGWSEVLPVVQVLGFAGMIAAGYIIWRTLAENPFASRYARIQDERSQFVVSSGPYQFVRHPMYTAIILLVMCLPLALGSWWALLPGLLISALFVTRTALEDRMLHEELAGYDDYARRTRYRLIPGVW